MGNIVRLRAVIDCGVCGCYRYRFLSYIESIACVDVGGVCLFTCCDNYRRALSDYRHLTRDCVDGCNGGVLALICNRACVGVVEGVCDCVCYVCVYHGAIEVDRLLCIGVARLYVHVANVSVGREIGYCGVGNGVFRRIAFVVLTRLRGQGYDIHIPSCRNRLCNGGG